MSFPDLPANDCRHRAALDIVDPGASNPSGVALAIHNAPHVRMSPAPFAPPIRRAPNGYPPAGEAAA